MNLADSFGSRWQVLKYLARYTHRVAISNGRLVALEDGHVSFRYKDYCKSGRRRTMRLTATEFIRRFLLHVLPKGFVRIRHYGLLANRYYRDNLAVCRQLIAVESPPGENDREAAGIEPAPGDDSYLCPVCEQGHLVIVATIPRARGRPEPRMNSPDDS